MDRFSEDDARRIFAEAARTTAPDAPDAGLSLAELQEIGRAAGLDPAAVAAAAAGLRDAAPDVPMWGKTPLVTRRSRVVPGTLTDEAWAEAVAGLRRTFKVQGVAETLGQQRTWTHAIGESVQVLMVRVTAETFEGGTRLTAESDDRGDKTAARAIAGGTAAFGLFVAVAGLLATETTGVGLGAALMALALAVFVSARWSAARRARTEPEQFDAALDRIAALIPSASEPVATPVPAGCIDPALLEDELDAEALADARRRDRA